MQTETQKQGDQDRDQDRKICKNRKVGRRIDRQTEGIGQTGKRRRNLLSCRKRRQWRKKLTSDN